MDHPYGIGLGVSENDPFLPGKPREVMIVKFVADRNGLFERHQNDVSRFWGILDSVVVPP